MPTEAPTVMSLSLPKTGNGCVKCGVAKKSGKRSCCARGGAWFKNCGDAGNMNFDHTWTEGIRACKSFVNSVPDESDLNVMLGHIAAIHCSINATTSRNRTRDQGIFPRSNNIPASGATCYGDGVVRAKIPVCVCFLLFAFHLRM